MARLTRTRLDSEERKGFLDYSPPSPSHTSGSGSGIDVESLDEVLYKKPYPRNRRRDGFVSWSRARVRRLRRSIRRHPLRSFLIFLKYLLPAILGLLILTPLFGTSYLHPPPHYLELKTRCQGKAAEPGCANSFDEKVFISVSLYDKDGHLSSGPWGQAVIELIHLIGANNVFLSIYQNDSGPDGEAALENFKRRVPCRHSIVNDVHVDLDGFPNVTMPDGSQRVKRLTYLSEMRNRALRPLDRFQEGDNSGVQRFDKILFLNDVAFRPMDAAQLLFSTNVGSDGRTRFLSACALDYMNPLLFYDLYAQRDAEGYSNGLPIFPIFSNEGQGLSRAAMGAQSDAVPVKSCWGGMVAMQARYVQNMERELPRPDFQNTNSHVIDPARPRNVSAPIRFRYEPEVFFDACECCLFQADVSQVARQADAKEVETFVNPYVRVAYSWKVLRWLPIVQRWEKLISLPQRILNPILGLPTHNPHRTVEEGDGFVEEVWDTQKKRWKLMQRVGRNGMFCGVRDMQLVMKGEREGEVNWVNTITPPGQTLNFPR
ncbi:hypothetical protein MCOR25_002976 [Pyricularia grisea]|uniref:Glycosyltransferase family 69 protein n=1 Tax=Pyricularia grisea TaxID=148305 RepID=A0A6P8AUW4_PYRGI|nr:uncharacterized protein PgNI_08786 [Pyricularia grisea]KAI6375410.1 hypothetical protein MCOR25_002976 [Pyricularia grisea]TLD05995.1 hypothetical protein PgNI_08786 [Pyricularia grisea]